MREALLGAGYATLALDAATHGERSQEIRYQHVNTFDDSDEDPFAAHGLAGSRTEFRRG